MTTKAKTPSKTAATSTKTINSPAKAREKTPCLSVVVPCYNEAEGFDEMHKRLSAACKTSVKNDYEIIYINDGSKDDTWNKIQNTVKHDKQVRGISFSRNFGHAMALTAGLDKVRGERILIIDADLQDPPEILPDMMKIMDEGADVVYGQRISRSGESYFKTASASFFYRLLNKLSDYKMPVDTGDFRLMNKRVLETLKNMPEYSRYTRGMVAWVGFNQQPIMYHRDERFAGETQYTLEKMVKLALDALTGFTNKPLRLAFYLSFFAFMSCLALILYTLFSYFIGNVEHGWTSLAILITFSMGIQCFLVGLLGEYVGRIYDEAKNRPKYIISDEI